VHELEPLLGSEARLLWKGESPLLRQHTDVIELLHVIKARQASYHPLGTKPLQGLEVKMPETLVPLPRLIVLTSSKAEGLCYLHIEDIESIGASDIGVKLSEELSSTGHVMGDAGVEAPPVSLVAAGAVAEEGVCSRLIKVEESRCGRCHWR
jgi:hypothetical protein